MHAGRPSSLASEQRLVAGGHQHDDGGVGAREMDVPTALVRAAALMAAFGGKGRGTASAAIEVPLVPEHQPAGVGEQCCIGSRQQRPDLPQVYEPAARAEIGGLLAGAFE